MHWVSLLFIWIGITVTFGLLNVWLVPFWRWVGGTYNNGIWARLLRDGGLLFWGVALLSSGFFSEIHGASGVLEDTQAGKWGTFCVLLVADLVGIFFACAAAGVAAVITQGPTRAPAQPGGQAGGAPARQADPVLYASVMLGLLLFVCSAVVTGALLARG